MAYDRVANGDEVTAGNINQLYDSMEKVEGITAQATTLEPGTPATADVQTDSSGNKTLLLGLPKGLKGDTGTNGKSLNYKGEWSASINYINTAIGADIVKKDGSVYICKQSNQGAPPPNGVYWDLFVAKGDDGEGSGNIKGTNVSVLEVGKTYAIQATNVPSAGGTLEGILTEVASVGDVDRKLEKNFEGFYSEKTTLADDDMLVVQDGESLLTPKENKLVKVDTLKGIKVDSAVSADTAATPNKLDKSTKISTTEYVRDWINNFNRVQGQGGHMWIQDFASLDALWIESMKPENIGKVGTGELRNPENTPLGTLLGIPDVFSGYAWVVSEYLFSPSQEWAEAAILRLTAYDSTWNEAVGYIIGRNVGGGDRKLTWNGWTVKGHSQTVAQSDNSTANATTAYVRTAISNFYGSAALGVSPSLSASTNIIKRQGNLVMIDFRSSGLIDAGTYTFQIPYACTSGNTSLTLRKADVRVLGFVFVPQSGAPPLRASIYTTVSSGGNFALSFSGTGLSRSSGLEIVLVYEM